MPMQEQDKKTLQIGLFLAAVVLVGGVYCHFMIFSNTKTRTMNDIETVNSQIREQSAMREDLIALGNRREEIEALAEKIQLASLRLPDTRNAQEFYSDLVRVLHTTGVDYHSVRPLPDSPHQLFTELPYTLTANAAFHEFGQFLNLLEENPNRFMRVSHIDISNDRDRPTVHPVNLEVKTFMLHSVGGGLNQWN